MSVEPAAPPDAAPSDTPPPFVPLASFAGFEPRELPLLKSGGVAHTPAHPDRPYGPFVARLDNAPPALRDQLAERGWVEYDEDDPPSVWHLFWKCSRFRPSDYEGMTSTMRINHIPKSHHITRKDMLMRNLRKLKSVHGNVFNFFPEGYLLPSEYTKFVKRYSAQETKGIWICKPSDMSRGRKIFLIRDLGDLSYDQPYIIQRYLERPLCVGGYKMDLRLYVLVASVFPLRAYLYGDGLVRFGTEKYAHDGGDLDNLYSHLTNSSINKFSGTYGADKDIIGAGCKWSFAQLWRALLNGDSAEGTDEVAALVLPITEPKIKRMWDRIKTLIICTLRFDVLIDANLKPWLVEVNLSPALSVDCDADVKVKVPLMGDTIDVLQHHAHEFRQRELAKQRQRAASMRSKTLHATRSRQRIARTGSASSMTSKASASGDEDVKGDGGRGGKGGGGGGGGVGGSRGGRVVRGGGRGGRGRGRGAGGTTSSTSSSRTSQLPKIGSAASMSSTSSTTSATSTTRRRKASVEKPPLPRLSSDVDVSRGAGAGAGAGAGSGAGIAAKPPTTPKPPRTVDDGMAEPAEGSDADEDGAAQGPFGGAYPGKLGGFEVLFPFSDETSALADQLTAAAMENATPVAQQDILRKIVAAVRTADRPKRAASASTSKKR